MLNNHFRGVSPSVNKFVLCRNSSKIAGSISLGASSLGGGVFSPELHDAGVPFSSEFR